MKTGIEEKLQIVEIHCREGRRNLDTKGPPEDRSFGLIWSISLQGSREIRNRKIQICVSQDDKRKNKNKNIPRKKLPARQDKPSFQREKFFKNAQSWEYGHQEKQSSWAHRI